MAWFFLAAGLGLGAAASLIKGFSEQEKRDEAKQAKLRLEKELNWKTGEGLVVKSWINDKTVTETSGEMADPYFQTGHQRFSNFRTQQNTQYRVELLYNLIPSISSISSISSIASQHVPTIRTAHSTWGSRLSAEKSLLQHPPGSVIRLRWNPLNPAEFEILDLDLE